jgi:subtilisin-like proprotein convertase family protein
VAVNIVHTFRGDLLIELVAPDGTAYRLKAASPFDSVDNVNSTYTVNVSGESANGNWKLQAKDLFGGDVGYINTWTLTL